MSQLALARALESVTRAARHVASALRRQNLSDSEVRELVLEAARRLNLNVSSLAELRSAVKETPLLKVHLAKKVEEVYRERYLQKVTESAGVAGGTIGHGASPAAPPRVSGHSVVGRALRLGNLISRLRISLGFEGADLEHAKMLSDAFDSVAKRVGVGNPFTLFAKYHSSRSFRAKVDAAVADAIAGIKDENVRAALLKFKEAGGNPLEIMAMAKLGLLSPWGEAARAAAHGARSLAAASPHLAGPAARLMAAPLLEILRQVPGMAQLSGQVASAGELSKAFFSRMAQNLAAFSEEWKEVA